MSLTFNDYQKQAMSTAVYPRQYVLMGGETVKPNSPSCIYPVFGLCGEIGEVAQVLFNNLGQRVDLGKECGDVLWYVAAICSDLSISMQDVAGCEDFQSFEYNTKLTNHPGVEEILIELFIAAGVVSEATKKTIRDNAGITSPERLVAIKAALKRVLIALAAICENRGISFNIVAMGNLKKLSERASKGTIGGSGDNR